MKLKIIPLFLTALALAGCAGGNGGSTSDPSDTSTSSAPAENWHYLDFLTGDNALRIDLFDIPEGLQFTYGNAALGQSVNNLTVDANVRISANKNLSETEQLNFVVVKDTKDGNRYSIKLSLGIEGNELFNFLALDTTKLTDCERAYVAISYGAEVKWTQGLNAKMDQDINARKQ